MKSESRPCDPEGLRRLLDEGVPEPAAQSSSVTSTSASPAASRSRPRRGGEWWEDARRFVGRDGETGECPEAAFRDESGCQQDLFHEEEEPASRNEMDLEFLAPSDTPGSLGRFGPYEIKGVLGGRHGDRPPCP